MYTEVDPTVCRIWIMNYHVIIAQFHQKAVAAKFKVICQPQCDYRLYKKCVVAHFSFTHSLPWLFSTVWWKHGILQNKKLFKQLPLGIYVNGLIWENEKWWIMFKLQTTEVWYCWNSETSSYSLKPCSRHHWMDGLCILQCVIIW